MRALELNFGDGRVELLDTEEGRTLWSSDDDDTFRSEFPDELSADDDVDGVIEFLIEHDIITEDEASELDVFDYDDSDESDESEENP